MSRHAPPRSRPHPPQRPEATARGNSITSVSPTSQSLHTSDPSAPSWSGLGGTHTNVLEPVECPRQTAWMDVTVAQVSAEACGAFVAAARASRGLHHPWINPPDSAERFEEWLDRLRRDDQEAYLIRHDSCGELVGYVSVSNIVRRAFQSAQLGYGAFASHAGRGLMTQGLSTVIELCFHELGLHRLEANIQPTNEPSLAIVRKLGFEREGYSPRYLMVDSDWRDHERWAIRTEIWNPS